MPKRHPTSDQQQLIHIAQSGHWNMTIAELLDALNYFFNTVHADVVQYTEVSPLKFQGPVEKWCEKQGLFLHHPKRAGANECLTISRIPINRLRSRARRLTDLRLKKGRVEPTEMLVTHIKGWGKFRFFHTPAHTAGLKPGLFTTRVWRSVMAKVAKITRNYKGKETAGGDINYDLNRRARTKVVDPYFSGLTYAGTDHTGNDLGGRLITGIWTNLSILVASHALKRLPGHDHAPIMTVLGRS